jgi:Outer membrane protein beta-barrel domain
MWVTTLVCSGVALPLAAQVGHGPQQSPYIDLDYRQEASLFGGYYNAGTDHVGVAPQSGPMIGLRYDLRLGGPASLTSKLAYVSSKRTVIDPRRPADQRVVQSDASWPIYMADVGISINLTGQRSYRRIVPFVNAGVGVATDFKGGADVGAWRFGTPFAFSFGGGIKWVPAGNLQFRADVTDQLYQIKYPDSYYITASDGTSVLDLSDSKSDWTNNIGLSLGVSYLFFR